MGIHQAQLLDDQKYRDQCDLTGDHQRCKVKSKHLVTPGPALFGKAIGNHGADHTVQNTCTAGNNYTVEKVAGSVQIFKHPHIVVEIEIHTGKIEIQRAFLG